MVWKDDEIALRLIIVNVYVCILVYKGVKTLERLHSTR